MAQNLLKIKRRKEMRDETKLVLSTMDGLEKYDAACKKTWKLREIIAPVLRYTVKPLHTFPRYPLAYIRKHR